MLRGDGLQQVVWVVTRVVGAFACAVVVDGQGVTVFCQDGHRWVKTDGMMTRDITFFTQ